MDLASSFDWKGLVFFLKGGLLVGALAGAGWLGFSWYRFLPETASAAVAPAAVALAFTATSAPVLATTAATTTPATLPIPTVSAAAYLVKDLDTGAVYAQKDANTARPIASVTKLMTALVAHEATILNRNITVPAGDLHDATSSDMTLQTFVAGDLLYPLLMESNNKIANRLAELYGVNDFVSFMNREATILDMAATHYADPSGISAQDVSTPEDLYRLAVYLAYKEPSVWDISRTPTKTISAVDGNSYTYRNFNVFSDDPLFIGGKVGKTTAAKETMVSVFSYAINGVTHRVAVIVLGSNDYKTDTKNLADWVKTRNI